MATVLIDKLLEACVKQGASDIHITTGQPPVFRLHGRLRRLETKVLESEDTVALMKSIAPERCQRELQEPYECSNAHFDLQSELSQRPGLSELSNTVQAFS